jgi:hypothetical protein
MKISGAIRTFKGVADFAALRSVAATARKQRWNILQTLTAHPHASSSASPRDRRFGRGVAGVAELGNSQGG